jgi:dihydroorotase/N-acyl-D-amino-acid deacylase
MMRAAVAAVLALVAMQPAQPPFDIVIANGRIVDGTGAPWYAADLGIRDGRIAAIGHLAGAPARQRIDAGGRVVAPGFIDMLGQSELTVLVEPHLPSKIFQGITTEITGEGGSVAPLNDRIVKADAVGYKHLGITPDWRTLGQYFTRVEKQGLGINMATYVGATQVRRMVLGDDDRQPTPAELDQMKALVREAMEQGAVGVSTSLQYAPAPYATTEELIALASEAARYGGIYATHMRSEGDQVLPAIDEAIRIGREAKIPVEIWHIKAAGKQNFGRMQEIVAKVEQARRDGVDIAADTYAYPAWFNSMSAFVPPWAHDGGDEKLLERLRDPQARARIKKDMQTPGGNWDNEWQEVPGPEAIQVCVVQDPALKPLQGKTIAQIAELWHTEPIDALLDLLVKDHAYTEVAVFAMSEPDITLAVRQPWVSFDNDSQGTAPTGPLGEEHPHPRAYGTFPRILRADVVVFDPATITDKATFEDPNQLSVGMEYVLVNGIPVIATGKATGALPGQILRGLAGR